MTEIELTLGDLAKAINSEHQQCIGAIAHLSRPTLDLCGYGHRSLGTQSL